MHQNQRPRPVRTEQHVRELGYDPSQLTFAEQRELIELHRILSAPAQPPEANPTPA